ncbi:MAG: hypothetical protein EA351_04055 [Gemmatimonadales bacterium]|nr:MAG: hypothetical protein EA351_04055 [Gemmatimonadales bacterium]
MDSHTSRQAQQDRIEIPSGPKLRLKGGLRRFLATHRPPSGTFRSGEARFQRVGEVTRSEVRFTNGLGRDTRAAHLSLGLAGHPARACIAGGELLLPN